MNIKTVLLVGGAAFLGYELFLKPAAAAALPDTIAAAPAGGIQPGPTGVAPTASASASVQAKIQANAMVGGVVPMLNIDQWCYYYAIARGVPCPDPLLTIAAADRGKLLSFDEFWGWATSQGLSGLGLCGYYRR